MKLSKFYQLVLKFGKKADPRKGKKISSFEDTAILYGRPRAEIRKILIGIDIEVGELLLAESLRSREGLDLVISHHPEGKALAGLPEVMRLQIKLLEGAGLSSDLASQLLEERMHEVERRVMPGNLMRAVDAAKILNLPFMCVHTPADNQVSEYLNKLFIKEKPKKVGDLLGILNEIPEYRLNKKELNLGPKVLLGNPSRPCGKILLEMTGGTEGNKNVYDKLYKAGIRTLVSMHLSEEHFRKVKDANLNVVIAGHISSDTLGLNLLLDKIEKQVGEKFQVIGCSGFRRIKRS